MCGIAGIISKQKNDYSQLIRSMTDALEHRGPNDSGVEALKYEQVQILLGHRRLSILDLSPDGHQPMSLEKSIYTVYNGEVYNFQVIKNELIKLGKVFNSGSDTEVILHAYAQWGISCINRFHGMFAFCIIDLKLGKSFIVRDRMGVKPLYILSQNDEILFASEAKSILKHKGYKREIDPIGLSNYFRYGYTRGVHSIYKNIKKLSPGHYIEIDLSTLKQTNHVYWDVETYYKKEKIDLPRELLLEKLEAKLQSCFESRLISDVPVGVFLSGGYDSSIVTALLTKKRDPKSIETFTIGFNQKNLNEAPHAKAVANHLGTKHRELICESKHALEMLPILNRTFDEPFADSSALPTLLVSQFAKKHVGVALSADGGDELFMGYPSYLNAHRQRPVINKIQSNIMAGFIHGLSNRSLMNKVPVYNLKGKMAKLSEMMRTSRTPLEIYDLFEHYFYEIELKKLIPTLANYETKLTQLNNDPYDSLFCHTIQNFLCEDVLVKVDRAAMAFGLEGRDPFLDQDIVEFSSQISSKDKLHDNRLKSLLKDITHKYIPKEIMDRPKMGFSCPIGEWINKDLKDTLYHYLDDSRIKKQGLFDPREITNLLTQNLGPKGNPHRLWILLIFQQWYFTHFENEEYEQV